MTPIPLTRPDVRLEDVEADIATILKSGRLTSGPFVATFEAEMAELCGVRHAVATTSATTALQLSLEALDIGPGDEVIVADFTFPATANAVLAVGATPILVDSGPDDFGLDPDLLPAAVNSRTAAVMPVDPFGQPADYNHIEMITRPAGIPVIADAACSLGASRDGDAAGAHGLAGCFSFHPRKIVTCGEGGMITTDDDDLATRMRRLLSHGAVPAGVAMSFIEPGFNFRMSEIQAAIGLSQLRRLDSIVADRRATAARYGDRLTGIEAVTVPQPPINTTWSYQSYVVVLDDRIDRDEIVRSLRSRDIESTIGTYACHTHAAYRRLGYRPGDLPNAARYQAQALTLPLVPSMAVEEIERVVTALGAAIGEQCHR